MKLERSDVRFPMWRKKVDTSLLDGVTPIPGWCCKMWDIEEAFSSCFSKKDPASEVCIQFEGENYSGNVTLSKEERPKPFYRLFFDDKLAGELKSFYQMTFFRSLENKLSGQNVSKSENTLPFWEFLDIEYDSENKAFVFVAHYTQEPLFPHLYTWCIGNTNT